MKGTARPIWTTILVGLTGGLCFVPLTMAMGYALPLPQALCTAVWLCVAAYGFLLTRWSRKPLRSIAYPLLLLSLAVFLVSSVGAFLLFALGVLGWIRSGICYQRPFGRRLALEILLALGSGVLVAILSLSSAVSWSLGIWMFFLMQALYFAFFEDKGESQEETEMDPFERARVQAERILL